ncbi:HNH endonuclease [Herbaspirillum sp. GCM10030257]|uniref:HNH endonuclease n=1 Tax=Herbaspirillum sp. GCM10030257 TaxID=3273393 RepID=UPI0036153FB8
MPRRPKSICRQAGCGKAIDAPGYCDQHRKAKQQADAKKRGTAHQRGYTSAWTRAARFYLQAHPLCERCAKAGRITAATVVDHRIPHRLKQAIDSGIEALIDAARTLFWDSKNNWCPLCKRCHDMKTARDDGGFGRSRK